MRRVLSRTLPLLASVFASGACEGPGAAGPGAPFRPEARTSEAPDEVEPDGTPLEVGPVVRTPEQAPPPRPRPAEPPPWEGTQALESNAAGYVIRYRAEPAEIPWGDPFALEVWVVEREGAGEPWLVEGAELAVDAAMPEHGHGMNRVPDITASGPGHFRVEGMLFHMPGRWELYFDVTEGALTERAQLEVLLD